MLPLIYLHQWIRKAVHFIGTIRYVIFTAANDVQYEWQNKSNVYGLIQGERTTKSFWPYNYKYIINNEHICTGSPIFLITFVSLCVNHFSRRNIV